jgi:hypothetical protein
MKVFGVPRARVVELDGNVLKHFGRFANLNFPKKKIGPATASRGNHEWQPDHRREGKQKFVAP